MSHDHEGLLGVLDAAGVLEYPGLRAAFTRVNRGLFIPEDIWAMDTDEDQHIGRSDDEAAWLAQVYSDAPVITQIIDGDYSSSSSMPSIVAAMITHLDVEPGMRVLEAGTGTGYNAALLSALVGDANVTTVETDSEVIERAHQSLRRAGFAPHVANGDASLGYPANAPYDRVIGTYAVHEVPYPWVEQTRPGGVVVTPWGTDFDNSGLLRLVVGDDGTATGRFRADSVGFMWDRGQDRDYGRWGDTVIDDEHTKYYTTELDPRDVLIDEHALFTIGLRVPDSRYDVIFDPEGSLAFTLWVLALDRASWAAATFEPGESEWAVEQRGPRRLWDEVEDAYAWWDKAGRPERQRYGITVTPTGQHIWLDEPPESPRAP